MLRSDDAVMRKIIVFAIGEAVAKQWVGVNSCGGSILARGKG